MTNKILIFAKAPIPGQVKTRLRPVLSPDQCARLQRQLTQHTLTQACEDETTSVELWCTPTVDHPFFLDCTNRFPVQTRLQKGAHLGERMGQALTSALNNSERVLLIGVDCPELDHTYLKSAFMALTAENDIVLGPAKDGGYVLIGARRIDTSLFQNIAWGTAKVLTQTRNVLQQLGWSWHELPTSWDVDRPEDLAQLRNGNSITLSS